MVQRYEQMRRLQWYKRGAAYKERHVNHRTMKNWMCEKGYSVLRAKKEIRQAQEAARREKAEASASSTGMMFVPMEPPTIDLQ